MTRRSPWPTLYLAGSSPAVHGRGECYRHNVPWVLVNPKTLLESTGVDCCDVIGPAVRPADVYGLADSTKPI